ncbi:MAG: universal stress protein [Thermoplasmata archaeon]
MVALDAKPPAPPFLLAIGRLGHQFGVEVIACHVVMRSTSVAGNEMDGSPANPEEVAILASIRHQLVRSFGEEGHQVPIKILHGDPGQRICEYARFAACDVIVLESRETTLSQRLRGSVRKYVAGASPCSVLILGDRG